MEIDFSRLAFGCFFVLIVGPLLWLPSLFNWRFRAETRRVRQLAAIIGPLGARLVYIAIGMGVSLIGLWFVITAFPASEARPSNSLAPTQVLQGFKSKEIAGLLFSHDGQRLLTGEYELRLWDATTGDALETITLQELAAPRREHITALAASADGVWIVIGFGDSTIHAQEAGVGRTRWDNLRQCEWLPVPFHVGSAAISPDGRHALAVGHRSLGKGEPQHVALLDFEQREVHTLTHLSDAADVASLGDTFSAVVARHVARLSIVDLRSGEVLEEIAGPRGPRGDCFGLAVSSDGHVGVTCHANQGDDSIRVWDLQNRAMRSRYVLRKAQGAICMASEANGFVLGAWMQPTVQLCDMTTGETLRTLSGPGDLKSGIKALAISSRGDRVAATSRGACFLWDVGPP